MSDVNGNIERTPINPVSWSIELGFDQAELIEGHQRILVCSAQDAMDADGNPQHPGDLAAQLELYARRLPRYPPGHPARRGHDAGVRGVRLPGSAASGDSGPVPRRERDLVAAVDAGDPHRSAAG